jgi:hypothetical protein
VRIILKRPRNDQTRVEVASISPLVPWVSSLNGSSRDYIILVTWNEPVGITVAMRSVWQKSTGEIRTWCVWEGRTIAVTDIMRFWIDILQNKLIWFERFASISFSQLSVFCLYHFTRRSGAFYFIQPTNCGSRSGVSGLVSSTALFIRVNNSVFNKAIQNSVQGWISLSILQR